MNQNQIGIAEFCGADGLAGTGGLNLHRITVGRLKHRQQIAQQTGILNGGGGRKTDDLGFLGGMGDLASIHRRTVLHIEQVFPILFKAVVPRQIQGFLAQEPPDQCIRTGSIHRHIGNGIAIGIGEGCLRIHSKQRVGIEHLVICFLEDAGIHHHTGLGRRLGGRLGRCFGDRLHRRCIGGRLGFRRFCAAGCQTENQHQSQHQGQTLFHCHTSLK